MGLGSIAGNAASALNAFSVDMMARANNIANVNTPGYHAQSATLTSGYDNQGVTVARIATDTTAGPFVPGIVPAAEGGSVAHSYGYLEGSNTDLGREFAGMISTQHAYTANAATIRAVDEMAGTLLNILV